ncbi:hypothetical protein [Bradyrhizobium liaoningense]|uniref:hypothetical protein n=1 Tax=Bradyrhizobium liaoningense TaxID=43992 RepID=UPI001BA7C902|nr:hypothetical protein [Bradyrhizobium liaoningense]MBR1032729.1 hypothetical protein [Bradyrhizobium liaoningense]
MKSTQAMRDRIRELMGRYQDDYDRAVECVLDDLESLISAPAQRPVEWREAAAEIIYDRMRMACKGETPAWVPQGNAIFQDAARVAADKIAALAAQPPAAPVETKHSPDECGRECQYYDYFEMLWRWFADESRNGAEDMRANRANGGLSADDFKQMLDDHEANLIPTEPQESPVSEFERDGIARCLFNKVMSGHAQWDEMTEPNKDDWRVKADEWMAAAPVETDAPAWHGVQDAIDAWAHKALGEDAGVIMSWSDRLAQHLAPALPRLSAANGDDLINRLRNPMWAHGNIPFESPQLEQEENIAAMNEAAAEIERLNIELIAAKPLYSRRQLEEENARLRNAVPQESPVSDGAIYVAVSKRGITPEERRLIEKSIMDSTAALYPLEQPAWENLTAIIRPMIESVCSDGNSDAARLAKDIADRIIASCSLTRPQHHTGDK